MTLAAGARLGPYEILSLIGAGGMGEVWKARDTRLGRMVAIKKVKEQHSERFRQEARSIAALNHPNICQIHDIGPDYLVLEYVEGKSLSGPLPEREAVRLAIQIAAALEEAHRNGIIHRDLKPSNVMVTDNGSVKLLDFGLAKLYEQSTNESTADFPATEAGAVLGTVAYMSPEQAQGQPADARSDIFAFGLVLYEMLSGRRAFAGDSTPAVMAALLRDEPPPIQVSPSLGQIMHRCLAKQASARYQTTSEVRTALEQAIEAKAVVSSSEPQPSIAVLPFVNMSGDKEQEYFSDGLAEDIIDALTQVPGLRVMARTSAFAFRGKEQDIREIGARLNVENILEGSVRRSGSRIRVTAQLVKARDGYHLWSQRFDREMTDVFAIQDEISQAIVEKLRVRLAGNGPLAKRQTENLEAYHLFLRGRHCMLRITAESFTKGREYLEKAIALDPNYAPAHAAMAEFYFISAFWGFTDPKESLPKAKVAALEALRNDDALAEVYAHLGHVKGIGDFQWTAADREFQRAIELNPASAIVRWYYGTFLLRAMGRLDEALSQLLQAVELDPLSAMYNGSLAYLYYVRGEYSLSFPQHRRAMDLDPGWYFPHWTLAIAYATLGRLEAAIAENQIAHELSGRNAITLGYLGLLYARVDRRAEARAILEELTRQSRTTYVPPFAMAAVCRGLGEVEQTFDWLEKGIEERDEMLVTNLKTEPGYMPLRSHPRYRALLRKMNLEA